MYGGGMDDRECTICHKHIDLTRGAAVSTDHALPRGMAHELCHLRFVADVRLSRIEQLAAENVWLRQELATERARLWPRW